MSSKIHHDLKWQMDSPRSQLFQIQADLDTSMPNYDYCQIQGLEIFKQRPDAIRARASRKAIEALDKLSQVACIKKPDNSWE